MPSPALRFPSFTLGWLAATSVLFLLLNDADGRLPQEVQRGVGITPGLAFEEPWRFLMLPAALLVNSDAVQYAYVTLLALLTAALLEARVGAARTAAAFFGAGLAGPLLAVALVFAPLALLAPGAPLVAHAWTRPYMGASSAAFACLGALAGSLPRPGARFAVLSAGLAWETAIWAEYFEFRELVPLFHYAAVGIGFAMGASWRRREGADRGPG